MAWIVRTLPVASIVAAVLLLALLLVVSTTRHAEIYRNIDSQMRYLSDLAQALDQQLQAAIARRPVGAAQIESHAQRLPEIINSLNTQLIEMHQPETFSARLSAASISAFNLIDPNASDHRDGKTLPHLSELASQADRLVGFLPEFLSGYRDYARIHPELLSGQRLLVASLRSAGRDDLADSLFQTSQQILAHLESPLPQRQQQAVTMLLGLEQIKTSLTDQNRQQLESWIASVEPLAASSTAMHDAFVAMQPTRLLAAIDALGSDVTPRYVHMLATISDARVLLNLYTVLLLMTLIYFGARLHASYRALNQSHGELEERVQARTADLEAAYEDLQESQVQLVQAEKLSSLGQLVAGVMHEINTPLLYVLNNTSLTAQTISDLQEYLTLSAGIVKAETTDDVTHAVRALLRQREQLDVDALIENVDETATLAADSIEGLHQISDLVASLKDFSRLDRAAEDHFNVIEGIEKTLTIARNLLKYGIEVEKQFQDVPEIVCSPARINQIFLNLITNAAQAMDGQGKLTISVACREPFIEIRFADTGCGIAGEHLDRIMDPFFTTKPVGQGTGLGLSIVRQIVATHHGHIQVESEVNQGTCVTVLLPIHPVSEQEAA